MPSAAGTCPPAGRAGLAVWASRGRGDGQRGGGREAFPVRQPTARPLRSSGRHRRAVPASLPQTAPALVLAVPGADTDLTSGPARALTALPRVDNPAVEGR